MLLLTDTYNDRSKGEALQKKKKKINLLYFILRSKNYSVLIFFFLYRYIILSKERI